MKSASQQAPGKGDPERKGSNAATFHAPVLSPLHALAVWLARRAITLLIRSIYRVRIVGLEKLPKTGGAILVANHPSWLDGVLLVFASPRPVRMIAWDKYINAWWSRWLTRGVGVIPIGPERKAAVHAIRLARSAIEQGELVGIFPEGSVSHNGQLQGFQSGFLSILRGTQAPVVPVYLDGMWGSVFSFEGGRFFWKWPRRLFRPVTIVFGRPLEGVAEASTVRRAVQELGGEAIRKRRDGWKIPPRNFLRMCRRNLLRPKVADSSGVELTGAGMLTRVLVLRRLLAREVLSAEEKHIGLLLPPTAPAVLANAALLLDRRVPINLNYTMSSEVLNHCIARAGIQHVVTSRRVMERFENLKIDAKVVCLEDFKDRVAKSDKLLAALQTWLLPVFLLERLLGLTRIRPDDVMTIIFTSGSTGDPKGVMLTHHNVGTNVEAFNETLRLHRRDVLIGILPLFHSFGYTVTGWAALMLDPKVAYHFSPLEHRQVATLAREHRASILVAAPTFLRTYLRRCEREDFPALNLVVTGAEKTPRDLSDAFLEKFGVRPSEGYGTTELSPVVSVNVPSSRAADGSGDGTRLGSVGRPLPGIAAKTVDLETGEELGPNRPGMLLIKGPNVMLGYLGEPERTAEVLRDGWYVTGDVAQIDEDGFIWITGRESRFSKIGGEMVPHLRIEEALGQILRLSDDELSLAVTAVPDERKGERVVVLHTGLSRPPEQLCRDLASVGLPPLWVPSPDSFCQVDEIPVLGSGKVDLRRLKDLALKKFAAG